MAFAEQMQRPQRRLINYCAPIKDLVDLLQGFPAHSFTLRGGRWRPLDGTFHEFNSLPLWSCLIFIVIKKKNAGQSLCQSCPTGD
jgi:hypothetical protein